MHNPWVIRAAWAGVGLFVVASIAFPLAMAKWAKPERDESGVTPPSTHPDRIPPPKGDTGEVVSRDGPNVAITSVDSLWTGRFLRVELAIYTTRPDKNFQFAAWSGSPDLPPVTDDLGNRYPAERGDVAMNVDSRTGSFAPGWLAAHGLKEDCQSQWRSGGVNAQVVRRDVIYYQLPVPQAKRLVIELPAKNIGGVGSLRLTHDLH